MNSLMRFSLLILAISFANQATAFQTLFIDNGILYGVTERSVVKVDRTTGERSIHYADGQVVEWTESDASAGLRSSSDERVPSSDIGFLWIGSKNAPRPSSASAPGSADSADFVDDTACARQSRLFRSAVGLVESACSDGGSGPAVCGAATGLMKKGYSSYVACLSGPSRGAE